jgi:hypothetical protein
MGNVSKYILDPGARLFGPFDTDDADMVMDLYERALGHLSDRALEGAFVIASREYMPSKRNPWPAPAIFARAAERVADNATPTSTDDRAMWQRPIAEDAIAAKTYMRECNSSLIDMALAQGWSKSLEDNARGVIRKFREANGRRPTSREMEAFRMSHADCDYYRQHGQPHLNSDRDAYSEARKLIVVDRPQSIADRITGERD